MRLGLGLWLSTTASIAFSPASLFAASEPGVWYDPSDLTTLFQDAAGTTPVTTPGQSVGLVLDKSGRGHHATQATASARPTYGVVPLGGRRNLLTITEDFSNAVWLKDNVSVTANAALAPDGTMTADKIVENTLNGNHTASQVFTAVSGTTYTLSAFVRAAERNIVQLRFMVAALWGGQSPTVSFNLTDQTTQIVAGSAFVGYGIQNIGGGIYRVWATYAATASGSAQAGIQLANATGSPSYLGDGTSGIYVWGAQLETGSTATNYQRVGSAFDVTEAGVPSLGYLSFDGVDDWLTTASTALPAGGRTIISAVHKRSDARAGAIVETQPTWTLAGGFAQFAPSPSGPATYGSRVQTSAVQSLVNTPASYAAPHTAVLSSVIADGSHVARVNGQQVAIDTPTGTLPESSAALAIGSRAGSSFFAQISMYGLIVRFGSNLTADQITQAETWMNGKAGAY